MDTKQLPVDILDEQTVFNGDRIITKKVVIAKNTTKETWEIVHRKKDKETIAHGVYIVAILEHSDNVKELIVIKQFRIALKAYVLELAGGFMKTGETASETALRELWEETGYVGKRVKCSVGPCTEGAPVMFNTFIMAKVIIDGSLEENQNPKQNIPKNELECIEVIRIPLNKLIEVLDKFALNGVYVMGELYSIAIGLNLNN